MKLPSVRKMIRGTSAVLRRFPLVMISAVVASVAAIVAVELNADSDSFLHRLFLVGTLGIPLLTALALSEQKQNVCWNRYFSLQGIGVVLLVAYHFWLSVSLHDVRDPIEKPIIRHTLFFIGSHLLVAIGPYVGTGETNGFWQYNKTLFLRMLKALLYSSVLYIGLSVALLSIDHLLGVQIDGERYLQLWIVLLGVFNTAFFLAGIPEDLDALDQVDAYPVGLRVFTQYVLVPLVIIYLLILYAYSVKIIWNQAWPVAWVVYLVLGFSVFGILSLLLLHPFRNRDEHAWVSTFSRGYYISLIPLAVLLLVAIGRRLSRYGFTENRYFVLVGGIWLGAVAIYYSVSNGRHIKLIPGSLCAIVFLVSFGPWGAFSVAESSQVARLEQMLNEHGILVEGQVKPVEQSVPQEIEVEVSAVVRYLERHHGYDRIDHWFDTSLTGTDVGGNGSETDAQHRVPASTVVEKMGFTYYHSSHTSRGNRLYLHSTQDTPLQVKNYDYLISADQYHNLREPTSVNVEDQSLVLELQQDAPVLVIRSESDSEPLLRMDLGELVDRLAEDYAGPDSGNVPAEQMTTAASGPRLSGKLYLRNMTLKKNGDSWAIERMSADLLLRFEK